MDDVVEDLETSCPRHAGIANFQRTDGAKEVTKNTDITSFASCAFVSVRTAFLCLKFEEQFEIFAPRLFVWMRTPKKKGVKKSNAT
jgi:hypothetical protein